MLEDAVNSGYRILGLEEWVLGSAASNDLILALRHDVDQHPRSALAMAAIEHDLGIRSTWYFRWRTADRAVVAALRDSGASVGLHYETLSRIVLERGLTKADQIDPLIPEAREQLREEIVAFQDVHGEIRSICAHGDTRAPLARNARLMQEQNPTTFGVEFEAYAAMPGRGIQYWLTDRPRAEGCWVGGVRPSALFRSKVSPILAVVHPNAWVSGPSLSLDRALGRIFPTRKPSGTGPRRVIRTGSDTPPIARAA